MYKTKKNWLKISDKIRFCIIGIINAFLAYLFYIFFLFLLGQKNFQLSLILSWVFSSFTSFFLHKHYVFRTKGNIIKQYLKCCTSWVIAYLINAILLEFFVKQIKLSPYLAQILAPAIAGIFTFFVFKIIVFNKKTNY